MDDSAYQDFFTVPSHTYQRRYEALRAVFVDARSQKEVAEQFGFTYGTMRQLVFQFRQMCDGQDRSSDSPFFETFAADVQSSRMTTRNPGRLWLTGGNWFCRVKNLCA